MLTESSAPRVLRLANSARLFPFFSLTAPLADLCLSLFSLVRGISERSRRSQTSSKIQAGPFVHYKNFGGLDRPRRTGTPILKTRLPRLKLMRQPQVFWLSLTI